MAASILNRTRVAIPGIAAAWLTLLGEGRASEAEPADALPPDAPLHVERDVAVRMRDGVVLRADTYRPDRAGRFPVLVYRTPYGKNQAAESYGLQLKAVARGYAVVLQDVRGRYASDGRFDPYRQEGRDGHDTIEWAASQTWSNGVVGTYGLSYPGAVQWLAAMEAPPHLAAMAPAMTFSSPRNFFYMNGVFDLSWLPWIYVNIAPNARVKLDLPGPRTVEQASAQWPAVVDQYLGWRPLSALPWLQREAPWYFEWLAHPPEAPWWDWAELRGRYARVTAAVLNLSGWYDEAYGPEGAVTNFNGLLAARAEDRDPRTHLVLGPWTHGVGATAQRRIGELDFGAQAPIDYDDVVLDFFDHYLRGVDNDYATTERVRHFVMGANEWRSATQWPPAGARTVPLNLAVSAEGHGVLQLEPPASASTSSFVADPRDPVVDPHVIDPYDDMGPHDYQLLQARKDVLTFDSEPLAEELTVSGPVTAVIQVSCDCRDFDLWVRLQDVYPDGRSISLMHAGNDVIRASYRQASQGRQPLEPGAVYELRLPALMTSVRFARGHRIRAQLSASFAPHMSRNLQTGESETRSAESRPARITIHHGGAGASRLLLPVTDGTAPGGRR